jgi:biopolymer transport protein ExbB/TolQ
MIEVKRVAKDGSPMRIMRVTIVVAGLILAIGLTALGLYVAYVTRLWYQAASNW